MKSGFVDVHSDKEEELRIRCILYALVKEFSSVSWKTAKAYAASCGMEDATIEDFIRSLKYNTFQCTHFDKIVQHMINNTPLKNSTETERACVAKLCNDVDTIKTKIRNVGEREFKSQMLVDVVQEADELNLIGLEKQLSFLKQSVDNTVEKWNSWVPETELHKMISDVVVSLEDCVTSDESGDDVSESKKHLKGDKIVTRSQTKRKTIN